MKIVFSNESKEDIINVVDYLKERDTIVADIVLDKIWYTCELLATMPKMGMAVAPLIEITSLDNKIKQIIDKRAFFKDLRKFPTVDFSKIIIFYHVVGNSLKIVRVLHSSRDIPMIFMEGE